MLKFAAGIGFILVLTACVAAHEAGHLLTAKRYGMRVTQYFIGFGPKIFSFRRNGTEYGLKALPAGGYVKIIGMTTIEEIPPELEPGPDDPPLKLFYEHPARKRTVVLSAGSAVHFLIAIFVLFIAVAIAGDQNPNKFRVTTTISSVAACVTTSKAQTTCPKGAAVSPAKRAGLESGDTIEAVNGAHVSTFAQLSARIRQSPGKLLTLTVLRDGRQVAIPVTPALGFVNSPSGVTRAGFLGVSPNAVSDTYGLLGDVSHTFSDLWFFTKGTATVVHHLPSEITVLVEGKPRTGNGPAGVIDLYRYSGQIAAATGVSVADKIGSFLALIAELNLFVGLFNLLPLLPLDGGHIAIIFFEEARSRFYRLIGRRDPGRVDILKVLPVAYTVILLFVGLTLLLVVNGIANPIRLQ